MIISQYVSKKLSTSLYEADIIKHSELDILHSICMFIFIFLYKTLAALLWNHYHMCYNCIIKYIIGIHPKSYKN